MKKINFYIGRKNLITFLVASVILLVAMYSFFDNVLYFFADDTPIDLGDALELNTEAFSKVENGDYVQIKGITSIQGGNIKKGLFGERHIVYYLNGSSKFIIESVVKSDDENVGPAYKTIKGRAYAFKTNKKAKKMFDFFEKSLFISMKEDGFFIEEGVEPRTDYAGLVIFLLFLGLMVVNVVLFVRPLKSDNSDLEEIDEL
ncbi:hypothetical protein J6Z39_02660 [bacterium]|nr:hypothetical protein [bacterium]MBP5434704.1 hypothetical protein [bacterium]